MQLTYFGANGWLLELAGQRLLLDPWLVGPLRFGGAGWLFEGTLPREWPIPGDLDGVLLTQGLPDHAHPATLERLPKELPVIGSAAAVQQARRFGFTQTDTLRPGERLQRGSLEIQATAGAPVPQVENGYLLRGSGESLYVEPHGFLDPAVPAEPLTAVITPVMDLGLPVAGAFVKGRSVVPQLLERFTPAHLLASTAGGDVAYSGLLQQVLQAQANSDEEQAQLAGRHPHTRFIDPDPGHCYQLSAD